MKNISFLSVLLIAGLFGLSACGIKPAGVEPPHGAEHDKFPHTYPDPRTDPQPGLENKY
ncbi:MAG: hypothetical protein ACRBDI_00285 [Alphaproteobacteria bacterium]